jgi:HD-GYP domain-containing protein (c-di-GMP phosphodiesterase class II)
LCEGKLDLKRIEQMRQHTLMSVRIMEGMDFLEQEIPAVRYHHERWDGKGYPEGISGSAIPLSARIIAVADTFDAITSSRVYRGASDRQAALGEIGKSAGTQFDPVVVEALIAVSNRMGEEMMPEQRRRQAGEYALNAAEAADSES